MAARRFAAQALGRGVSYVGRDFGDGVPRRPLQRGRDTRPEKLTGDAAEDTVSLRLSLRKCMSPRGVLSKPTLRQLGFASALACFLASPPPAHAQDAQPSVADAARAARKDKDKSKVKDAPTSKNVVTDENLSAGVGSSAAPSSSKLSGGTSPADGPSGRSTSLDPAWARLQATEASLDRVEPLGRAEVAQTVLNGNTADFPNRAAWEEKLYSAKGMYVQRSRQLIAAMKQVLADMETLQSGGQGKIADNDPRVQALTRKSQQIMQLAARTEAAFQSVVTEGQNLSLQSAPH